MATDRVLEMVLLAKDKASAVFQKVGTSMDKLTTKTKAAGKAMSSAGKAMTTKLTLPIVGVGIGIAKMAGDFEASMNRVGAISGATGQQFDALKDQAKELGRTTQYSASQASGAMGFLAMAGFEVNEITKALPGTLQLAAAGNLDLARAADIASNVLTGYRFDAEQLGPVNDVLAKTFTSTNTNLEMLGESFKYVGPVAAGMGVEFTNTAAAIGLLGNAGIQGSMAGTVLRGSLVRITQAVTPMGEALNSTGQLIQKLGLNFYDSQGNVKDFTGIVKELQERGTTASEIMQIFGQRAGPGMMALVQQGSEALVELEDKLKNAGGTAKEIAEANMKGFNGQMLKLKSAIEGAAIAIAESGFLEYLTEMAEKLTGLISKLAETDPAMLRLGTIIAAVVASLGPLLMGLGFMTMGMGYALGAVKSLTVGLAKLALGFLKLHLSLGPFIILLEAVAAAAIILWVDWDKAMTKMGISSDSTLGKIMLKLKDVQTVFREFGNFIMYSTDWLITGMMNLWEKYKQVNSEVWRAVASMALESIQIIVKGIEWMVSGLAKIPIIGKAFEGMAAGLTWLDNSIQGLQDSLADGVYQGKEYTSVLGWMNTALEETAILERDRAAAHTEAGDAAEETAEKTNTAIEAMKTSGTFLADQLAKGVDESEAPQVAIDEMLTEMDDAMMGFAEEDGYEAGEAFSQKYAEGVEAGKPAVQEAAETLGAVFENLQYKVEATTEEMNQAVAKTVMAVQGLHGLTGKVATGIAKLQAWYNNPTGPMPQLQHGGIVRKPTMAMIGEAGPEAVIPLNRMGGRMGRGGGDTFNVVFTGPVLGSPSQARLFAREIKKYIDQEETRGALT